MTHWKIGQTHQFRGIEVHPNNRMTEYNVEQWKNRTSPLLDEFDKRISNYEIDYLVAYRSQKRVGMRLSGHDPLGNGILVGNLEGFSVESISPIISPINSEKVYIRFQED